MYRFFGARKLETMEKLHLKEKAEMVEEHKEAFDRVSFELEMERRQLNSEIVQKIKTWHKIKHEISIKN